MQNISESHGQMFSLLEELNPEQRVAAETTEGPVLILAGAGTGKTRAITFRMANLIANGTPAEAILAVTFTNKAAQEMRNRVSDLLLRAGVPPSSPWLSTFHSLCARLLRREAVNAGLPRDFVIYDDDDQLAAVKLVMSTLKIEDDALTPRLVLSRISHAKNHAKTPEMIRSEAIDKNGRHVADIFVGYEKQLKQSGALDFDDLLLRTAKLFREVAGGARKVAGALSIHPGGRIPGHQPRAIRIAEIAHGTATQFVRRRRRGPIDLPLARRGCVYFVELFARFPERQGNQTGAKLSLHAADTECRGRGSGQQSGTFGQNAERGKWRRREFALFRSSRRADGSGICGRGIGTNSA